MLQAIKYCLGNLGNFSGRDARSTFWFFVLFLVIAQFLVGFAVSIPMTGQAMMAGFHGAREGASDADVQARIMQQLQGSIRASMYVSIATSLAMIALLYAAFVRRLHDSNKPGWIAAIVAVLQLGLLVYNFTQLDALLARIAAQGAGAAAAGEGSMVMALVGWLPLLIIVGFGVLGSTPGPNAYGDEPRVD